MELHEWAPPERIAAWVTEATGALLARVDDLAEDDRRWMVPYLPEVNPPIWEIAHAAWFAEWFVLRGMHGREALLDDVDARYDSGAVPHLTRWHLSYPDPATTRDYVRRVGDALAEVVLDDRGLDSTSHYALYAVAHFDAHTEALTYTRQTLGWPSPPGLEPPSDLRSGTVGRPTGDRGVDGGRLLLGASRRQPFVLDNEKWAHAVEVAPFHMGVAPVTVADYAAFVDDGGYDVAALWSPDGLAWRQRTGATAPRYWRRGSGGWEERHFDRWRPIEEVADHPIVHVCFWEAEAYCTWAGRRLPTEAEWEFAATTDRVGTKRWWYPWGERDAAPGDAALDGRAGWTVPVGDHAEADGPWGHRQLIGNVWEWTSSSFEPYPHFEPDAYRDNSEPWFGSRKVLRGGSWATSSRYVRSTFRNYFPPDRRDVLAGFRTCATD